MKSSQPNSGERNERALQIVSQLRVAALATCLYAMVWLIVAVVGFAVVLGLEPMLIDSGSMSPAIRPGDVVLITPTHGVDLGPGTVITYRDHALGGRVVTHRIFDVTPDGSYVTKGDANAAPDSDLVAPSDVIGAGRVLVPYVGLPAHWFDRGEWLPLSIWLAATIAGLVSIRPGKKELGDPNQVSIRNRLPEGAAIRATHPARLVAAPSTEAGHVAWYRRLRSRTFRRDRLRRIARDARLTASATYLYGMAWLVLAAAGFALLMGLQPVLIGSGSMSPALRPGDVLIVTSTDGVGLYPGTVVTFRDPGRPGGIVTHRIFDVTADGSYVTKGDANAASDGIAVSPSDVIGARRAVIPYVGLPAHWVNRGEWLPLAMWLTTTIAALASILPRRHGPGDPRQEATPSRLADRRSPEHGRLSRVAFSARVVVALLLVLAAGSPIAISGAALSATTTATGSITTSDWLRIVAISGGESHVCAARDQGLVWCWGRNDKGQLGIATTTDSAVPVQVKGPGGAGSLTGVVAIASGKKFNCAAKSDGTVFCWGENNEGQLGNNTKTDSSVPVQVKGPGGVGNLTGVARVAAGETHACGLKTDGTVWCWGRNDKGQLGNATSSDSLVPGQVKGVGGVGNLSGVSALTAGLKHTCATMADSSVSCWGFNDKGQLGVSGGDRSSPAQVVGSGGVGLLSAAVRVAAGESFTCVTRTDGSVWCWGRNDKGQLGRVGGDEFIPAPAQGPAGVGLFANAIELAAGQKHVCAVKGDASVWCWGLNDKGQLGNNTATDSTYPVQVRGPANVGTFNSAMIVGATYLSTCAARTDYTVWCWGHNDRGQLGNGTTTDSRVPVRAL